MIVRSSVRMIIFSGSRSHMWSSLRIARIRAHCALNEFIFGILVWLSRIWEIRVSMRVIFMLVLMSSQLMTGFLEDRKFAQ